jgi:prevent-host-death family protein
MSTMRVSIKEARQKFSELVNTVALKKERVIITSRNKPKAVLVSIQDAETLEEGSTRKVRRRVQLESVRRLRDRLAKKGVVSDSLTTLERLRGDRLGELANGH